MNPAVRIILLVLLGWATLIGLSVIVVKTAAIGGDALVLLAAVGVVTAATRAWHTLMAK